MSNKHGHVYYPSKLFVDQLEAMLEFVTARNVAISEVPVPELTALLGAQRAQNTQDESEDQRHESAVQASSRVTAERHQRFMQMLGALRSHFLGDPDALALLDHLKPERDVAKTAESRAERAKVRAAEVQARLEKAMAYVAKLQTLVAERKALAAKAADAVPSQPTPGPTPEGK